MIADTSTIMNNKKSHEERLSIWKKRYLKKDLAKKSRIGEIKKEIKSLKKENRKL